MANRPPYYSTAKQYIGDEIWQLAPGGNGNGLFNFVLSEEFFNKTKGNKGETEWNAKYSNHFNENLNTPSLVKEIPTGDGILSYEVNYDGVKKFYPIAYVRENTMNTQDQLNGYSTGVIFRTKFEPNENFRLTQYNQETGSIDEVELKKHDIDKFEFLTAEHFDGKEVRKVVYADVRSVAARAFDITGDTKDILKGFMNGWGYATNANDVTLRDLADTIGKMSQKNKLSGEFKKYLKSVLTEAAGEGTDLSSTKVKEWSDTAKLTYKGFYQDSKNASCKDLLDGTTALKDYKPTDIENLARDYEVYFYRNGQSYHKYWIRHEDNNNDNEMGVMEFAIVRNNVYQLNVTGVRDLGDPLPYTPGKDDPGTPDESNEITIDVTVYVNDWVRRYNKDIIL